MPSFSSLVATLVVGQAGVSPTGVAPTVATPAAGDATNGFSLPPQLADFSNLPQWWDNVSSFVLSKGVDFVANAIAALIIVLVGRWAARLATRLVGSVALKAKMDATVVKFAANLVYAAVLAFVILSALDRLGIDTTSFTAVVAAAGLAVGFALQGSLSNFAAGVLLIVFKPFRVGDQITAGGATGLVEEIQIFSTLLRTDNNALVIVPNSSITTAVITNHSAEPMRRIDLSIRCAHDNDLRFVKRTIAELLAEDERILQLPPPLVAVDQLADNAVVLAVQPWVPTEFFAVVRTDLLERLKLRFEERGIRLGGPAPAPAARPKAA